MNFRLLGPVEAYDAHGSLVPMPPRERTVLAVLLLDAGQVVSRTRLTEALWEADPPSTARDQIYTCVCRLRGLLRASAIADIGTAASGYRISVGPDAVDVLRFRRTLQEAYTAVAGRRWTDAIHRFRAADRLWRGPALGGVRTGGGLVGAAAAIEELRVSAIEDRLDLELRHHPGGHLVAELLALVHLHPFRERVHGLLMRALYQYGRKAEALAAYEEARRRLADELGIDPGRKLRELHRAMLRDDPSVSSLDIGWDTRGRTWRAGRRRHRPTGPHVIGAE